MGGPIRPREHPPRESGPVAPGAAHRPGGKWDPGEWEEAFRLCRPASASGREPERRQSVPLAERPSRRRQSVGDQLIGVTEVGWHDAV